MRRWVGCAPIVMVFALGVAACSGSDAPETSGPTTKLTLLPTTTTTLPPTTTSSSTTTTVPTSTSTSTTTTTAPTEVDPAVEALVLTERGIGTAEFGSEPESVIAYMSSYLGEPTGDTGWIDPFELGVCPGTVVREVSWGVLTLAFGDVSNIRQGARHFVSYSYGHVDGVGGAPTGLRTDSGLVIGSRVVDLVGAYPEAVLIPEDEFTPPSFFVNDNFRGHLTGLADDDTVTVLFGGQGCAE